MGAEIRGGSPNLDSFLYLLGRTGTTNDPLISTDNTGSIYGTGLTGVSAEMHGLALNSKQETTLGPFNSIFLDKNVTTWVGLNALLAFTQDITINSDLDTGFPPVIVGYGIGAIPFYSGGTWTIGDDSIGGPLILLFFFHPIITNPTGVAKILALSAGVYADKTEYISDGAACTLPGEHRSIDVGIKLQTINGGTLTVENVFFAAVGAEADAGVSIQSVNGLRYEGVVGAGSIVDDIFLECADQAGMIVPSGLLCSLRSATSGRQMRHAGQAVFGAAGDLSNSYVGLELMSTTLAFLPSRMTTTQRNALTPLNGMILYNSTTNKLNVRENGAWTVYRNTTDVIDLTTEVTGILPVANGGTGQSTQKSPNTLFDHFADAGNSTTTETDLYSDTIAAGQLSADGSKLEAEYGGVFVSSATATRQIRVYFGGTMIFDTGALTLSLSSSWMMTVSIMRKSSTAIRFMIGLTTEGAALAAYTTVSELFALTLSNTNILKITGQAAGVGAATNDIVAKIGSISYVPQA